MKLPQPSRAGQCALSQHYTASLVFDPIQAASEIKIMLTRYDHKRREELRFQSCTGGQKMDGTIKDSPHAAIH